MGGNVPLGLTDKREATWEAEGATLDTLWGAQFKVQPHGGFLVAHASFFSVAGL